MSLTSQLTTYLKNGISVDIQEVENPYGVGISQPSLFLYNVVPITESTDLVALQQNIAAGANVILNEINASTFLGALVVNLDCLRCLSYTVYGGATTTNTNVTVKLYDDRNIAVTYIYTIPSGTAAGTHNLGTNAIIKAGMKVSAIQFSADPGQQISIGTASILGLPYFIPHPQYILNLSWNNTALNQFDNTIFVPGYQFNPVLATSYVRAPSATTGEARGLVVLPSPTNGATMMTCFMYVYGGDSYLQNLLTNENTGAIVQTQILPTAVNFGQMLDRDEVGLQYPGGA